MQLRDEKPSYHVHGPVNGKFTVVAECWGFDNRGEKDCWYFDESSHDTREEADAAMAQLRAA